MTSVASGRNADDSALRLPSGAPQAPSRATPRQREDARSEAEDDAELALEELIEGDDDDLALIAGTIRRLSAAVSGPPSEPVGRRRLGRLAFAAGGRIVPELPGTTDADEVETALDEILRVRLGGGDRASHRVAGETEEVVACCGVDEFVCQACFLIKHRRQLADPVLARCVDCAG